MRNRYHLLLIYFVLINVITGIVIYGHTQEYGRNAIITTEPLTPREKNVGDSIILNVVASGNPPLNYQWEKKNGANWEALNGGSNEEYSITSVSLLDDGIYRVRVWDTGGADTSIDIVLLTYSSPIVTSHPINDTVLSEQVASFSINAAGNNLTYQWQKKSGSWINIDGAVHSMYSFQAGPGDNGLNIRCIVSSGSLNTVSSTAMVVIGSLVSVQDLFPSDTAILLSDTITLSAQADGVPYPEFEWFYLDPSSHTPVSKGKGSKLSILNTSKSDSGIYYFIASNKFNNSSSDSILIHVVKPVYFSLDLPNKCFVTNNGEAVLSVDVEGDGIITYKWYENNKMMNNQTGNSISISQIDSSIHHNKVFYFCLVENKIGNTYISSLTSNICTLMVSSYYNPFRIKAEIIDKYNTSRIRIKQWSDVNISEFPANKSILPWADSIWIMYKTNEYAKNSEEANILLFSTQNIRSVYPDTIIDTINILPLPTQHDSSYWFTYSILWHIPSKKDTLLKPFTDANRLFLIDTIPPSNSISISGEYIDNTDSAMLTMSNILEINELDDSLVIIECSDYEDFSTLFSFKNIPVSNLITGGDTYRLNMKVGNVPFKLKSVYCRWKIMSRNKCVSIHKNTSFSAGQNWIEYDGTLNADSTMLSDEIKLWWNKPVVSFDSIRIWWDSDTIPLVHEFNLPKSQVLNLSPLDTVDTIRSLTNNTIYHFGLQIYKSGMWSYITEKSRTSAITAFGDTTTTPNVIKIDTAWFHDTTNKIFVQWHININSCPPGFSYQSGYTYSPDSTVNYSIKPLKWDSLSQESNLTVIDPGQNLIFDTLYTVGMWLRCYSDTIGGLNPSPPTDSSVYKITVPSFTWQAINLFPKDKDIIFAAGNRIVFHKIPNYSFPEYLDTLWAYNTDTPLPKGFVDVGGISFSFGNKSPQTPPFILGLKYDSLPPEIKRGNLGLYQYIDGKFHVLHGFNVSDSMVCDTLNYNEMADPFFILADTLKPNVEISEYSDTVTSGNGDISTKFAISDNIANVRWQFMYNSGDRAYGYETVGFLDSFTQTVNTLIKDTNRVINHSFGIRAMIIVNDGPNRDTFNVSRQVINVKGEVFGLKKNEWSPLRVTSHLEDTTLEKVFFRSFSEDEKWEYDNKKFRLFRWYNNDPGKENRWVEYSEDSSSGFFFKPGNLIWCKAAEDNPVKFGRSITVSLKKPYEIELKPLNWTDISHPFQFPVLIKDILIATGAMSDSIDIQYWQHNGKTSYSPTEIYNSTLDSIENVTDTIRSKQRYDGYTVYNHSVNPITLKIPPVPLALSDNHASSKSNHYRSNYRWDIKFLWRNKNDGYNSLYRNIRCAYIEQIADKRIFGPLPPSFSKIKVGIRDTIKDRICGYAVENSLKEGGTVFEIAMINNSDKDAAIEYCLGKLTTLPDGVQAKVLNPENITYEGCSESVKSNTTLKINSLKKRLLVVGTNDYFRKIIQMITPFRLSFLNAYPNPFRGALNLQYTIPAEIKEVQFTMFNVKGKTLWKYKITDDLAPGTHTLIYNKDSNKNGSFQFSSGIYILRLTALNSSGKLIYGGERRLIFIK